MIISQGYYENGGTEQGGGVVINGSNNVVRGCTLFNTAGSGVYSSGTNNLITRNLIYNTDYSGTYACCIALHGSGEIVTFNTAHNSGRDILRPEGTGSDIRFNDLSVPGLLCKDLGVTYQWGINGGGTRIACNWVHDNTSTNDPRPGIYIDNWCRNFIVDHNVVWNCPHFRRHPHQWSLHEPSYLQQHALQLREPGHVPIRSVAQPQSGSGVLDFRRLHLFGIEQSLPRHLTPDTARELDE